TVADFAQADNVGHVLQLAMPVGRTRQAVEWVIGNVEFHDSATEISKPGRFGCDLHAGFCRSRAGSRKPTPLFYFDQAQTARSERLERIGRAEFRDVHAGG